MYFKCISIFQNKVAYFSVMKNIYDTKVRVNFIDTHPNKTLEKHAVSIFWISSVRQDLEAGHSSHVQLSLFLTFNYSLSPVSSAFRVSLICPLLYLACGRTRDQALTSFIRFVTEPLTDLFWLLTFWFILYMNARVFYLKSKNNLYYLFSHSKTYNVLPVT